MASASKDSKGWRVLFVDANGQRRQLRPGKVNKATAEQIGRHIDSIVGTMASRGTMERQTALWLGEIGDKLHAKLANAGLIEPRVNVEPEVEAKPEPAGSGSMTLKKFMRDHIAHGRTAKGQPAAPATIQKWIPTETFLNEVFPKRTLDSITAEDAYQFRVWLDKRRIKQKTAARKGEPMKENAKRRHIATCKMFFNAAKRRGLVAVNPFEAQVSGTQPNRSRDHYIAPDDTRKLLAAAPCCKWRLLIALWRLAGLRKMEVFNLKWGDVLWEHGKLLVRIPKTEHHAGCDIRYVPLRDVREYLEDAFQDALEPGQHSLPADKPIISRVSNANSNLDKPFVKIVESAGLVPWPKLFQNLRASCETQWLKEGERADLVANWIGHSVTVQRKNYVQHTDDDIHSFNEKPAFKSGTHSGTVEPRITRNGDEPDSKNTAKTRKASVFAGEFNPTRARTRREGPSTLAIRSTSWHNEG